MPELPEVQTVVDTLRPKALGHRITAVQLVRQDILRPSGLNFAAHLIGRTISDIHRRGKKIIFQLNDANRFYIHLGMSGRLSIEAPGELMLKHTHLSIEIGQWQIRFRDPRRFGGVWWLGLDESPDKKMGPEPLLIRTKQLKTCLAKTTRAIKNALLDQSVIAGLGNIYVDESLFRAGIHPLTPADKLSLEEIGRLNRAIKFTLRKAIRYRGSTLRDYFDANGDSGGFQKLHAVYGREGLKCRRCGTAITRIVLGGRSTHFCMKCQPKQATMLG